MSATKTARPSKYTKYFPNYDYSQCHTWSMSDEDAITNLENAMQCFEKGDEEGYMKWSKKVPLPPNIALRMRDEKGKGALLAEGWNLADAEIVYGKDWLDNYMIDDDEGE